VLISQVIVSAFRGVWGDLRERFLVARSDGLKFVGPGASNTFPQGTDMATGSDVRACTCRSAKSHLRQRKLLVGNSPHMAKLPYERCK
jgi:hypothetical protein